MADQMADPYALGYMVGQAVFEVIVEVATAGAAKAVTGAKLVARLKKLDAIADNATLVRRLDDYIWMSEVSWSADDVARYSHNLIPEPGFRDVIIHGERGGWFKVIHNGEEVLLDHRSVAAWLRKQGVTEDVRLLTCWAGEDDLAQDLANKLGVRVIAGSHKVGILKDAPGVPTIRHPGEWFLFRPGKPPVPWSHTPFE